MKARGRRIAIALLCLAGAVGVLWAAIALPPWIREERTLARMKSPAPKEQDQAIEAIAEMGSVKAVPTILEIMGRRPLASNPWENFNFMDPLKLIIEKRGYEAVFPLVNALKSPDRNIRSSACELLGDIGTEARIAIPSLTDMLEDPDPSIHLQATKALFEVSANEECYLRTLEKLADDQAEAHEIRMQALRQLSEITPLEKRASLIPRLIQALDDNTSGIIGYYTLEILKDFGPGASAAIPSVMAKVRDPKVAYSALVCLGSIGADRQEVQDLLRESLGRQERGVRSAAAIGLLKSGARAAPALPVLKELMKSDSEPDARAMAACAVLNLEHHDALAASTIKPARDSVISKWVTRFLRSEIGDSVGVHPNEAVLLSTGIEDQQMRVFIDALKDPDKRYRRRAAYFLEFLGPAAKPALGAILEAARDPYWRVRAQAAETLGAMGPTAAEAIPVLNEMLKTRNAAIRDNARRALRRIQKK